uniref:F-box domain-containing protein n=1 Tax=Mycena chlorophos TaxID=658473 RepID=A0ABQ0M9E9_MYCCL|nr:predicted protein [Mycena chlorophos]
MAAESTNASFFTAAPAVAPAIPPRSASAAEHRVALAKIDAQLDELAQQAARLASRLEARRGQLNEARACVVDALGASSTFPFNALAVEIIASIFVACLPDDDGGYVLPSTTTAPLLFTLVCRRWRHIALTTTTLWRSIEWELKKTGSGKIEARRAELQEEGLARWVERTRCHPMALRLPYPELPSVGRPTMPTALAEVLPRLWRLRVDLPRAMFENFIRIPTDGRFTSLRVLTANFKSKSLKAMLRGCPELRELRVLRHSTSRLSISAPMLQKLRVDASISVVQLLETLRDCVALIHIRARVEDQGREFGTAEAEALKALTLPGLQSLNLRVECTRAAQGFLFMHLECLPGLTSAGIRSETIITPVTDYSWRFHDLLERSACAQLRRLQYDLRVYDTDSIDNDVLDLRVLTRFPDLEVLDVKLTHRTLPEFFDRITGGTEQLFQLRKLRITVDPNYERVRHTFDMAWMLDFIELYRSQGRLETLWIVFSDVQSGTAWRPHAVYEESIAQFMRDGLDFAVVAVDGDTDEEYFWPQSAEVDFEQDWMD